MKRIRILYLLVVVALLVALLPAAGVVAQDPDELRGKEERPAPQVEEPAKQPQSAIDAEPAVVGSASDRALARLDPLLHDAALAGGGEEVLVLVLANEAADLSPYGEIITDRMLEQFPVRRVFMRVPARYLLKLSGHPDVAAVSSMGPKPEPEPPDPEAALSRPHGVAVSADAVDAARIEELREKRTEAKQVSLPDKAFDPDAMQPLAWYENDTQGVTAAWNIGVTGDGDDGDPVMYSVIDTGVDFCNPSLYGRWAVQPNTGFVNPAYVGWPIAYDDRSASEFISSYPASGSGLGGNWGWYVNASRRVTGSPPFVFTDDEFGIDFTVLVPSASGIYRYGYHPDYVWSVFGNPAVLLVVDSTTPGVYDTVIVDGDWNGVFGSGGDVVINQSQPAGCLDWLGSDNVPDDSWGLLYWISDGANPPPTLDWMYSSAYVPPAGEVLMFMINDATGAGGDHGTLCASSAAGAEWPGAFYDWQGVLPTWYGGTQVIGGPASGGLGGPPEGAQIIAVGNTYAGGSTFNEYFFTTFGIDGYLPTGDEANITSMSFGSGGEDADAWDFQSEFLATINLYLEYFGEPSPLFVQSSGNGGNGYGTVNTPGSVTALTVGASTQYGPYDWWGQYEGVSNSSRPVYHDVQPWSDRGPTAMSTLAPQVVTNGAWGSGAIPQNLSTYFTGYAGDGAGAWDVWGGTSRSGPVAAGMAALVFDAYWQGTGVYPDWRLTRQLVMNGTLDITYDEQVAGSGQAYALRSAEVARGDYGVYVDPPYYQAGSFPPGSGDQFESFAVGLLPGESDQKAFTVYNPSTNPILVSLRDEQLQEIARYNTTLSTLNNDPPTNYDYGAPDYVLDLTPWVEANPTADLMIVRVAYPFDHFADDPTGAPAYKNRWIGLVYNVYDDGDGVWWTDKNADGRVTIAPVPTDPSHELDPDDEHIRFTYSYLRNTQQEMRVQNPYGRMGDAIYLGLTHNTNDGSATTHNIEVIFYEEQDWDQVLLDEDELLVPPGTPEMPGMAVFTATINAFVDNSLLFEDFEGDVFPPPGWTVVNNGGDCEWRPGSEDVNDDAEDNYTGGADEYADADSDDCGMGTSMNTELILPALDLSGLTEARLQFKTDYDTYSATDTADVDVSTDGSTWTNVWRKQGDYWGPKTEEVNLDAWAGQANVLIRFHYYDADWEYWWQVDDVMVYDPAAGALSYDPPGEYMGRIVVSDPGDTGHAPHDVIIPIEKQVWFEVTVDPVVGGTPPADTPYDNGRIYGAFSWTGRSEVGDWRVFPFVVTDPPPGAVLLVDNVWEDYPTDIDTLLLDQVPNWDFGTVGGPPGPYPYHWFGPYTMDYLGNGSVRSGARPNWNYYTNMGTNHEFVAAPAYEGLHVMLHHAVLYGGNQPSVPFTTTVATAAITPNPIVFDPGYLCVSNTMTVTFKSGLDLPDGLELGGSFGWYLPIVLEDQVVYQDDPDDPSTSSWIYPIELMDSFRLDVQILDATGPDVDLFVVRDVDSSGTWTDGDYIVGSSGSPTSDESVSLEGLEDGDYLIAVHGWSVSPSPGLFDIYILNLRGAGALSVEGLPTEVVADEVYEFAVHVEVTPPPGEWQGTLLIGPPQAPTAIEVPVWVDQGEAVKEADPEVVQPGEEVEFTITVTENPGETVFWNVEDMVPAGFEFVSVEGADYDAGTDTIYWNNADCEVDWLDATGGIPLNLSDDGEANVAMPFEFTFYDTTSDTLRVGNNGGILFDQDTGDVFAGNSDLGTTTPPDYLISPFWDDIDSDTGNVYIDTFGEAPNRQFVVEWFDRPHFSNLGSATFEAILDEASGDIWFLYDDVDFGNAVYDFGAGATIGVRATDADGYYTQHSYNTASVWNNWALQFTPVDATSYNIAYDDNNCTPLPFGTHTITLTLRALEVGYRTNTAYVSTGPNACPVEKEILVAGALPDWKKVIWIDGVEYGPEEGPFAVTQNSDVAVVDHVTVTGAEMITFNLLEEWTDSLNLVGYEVTGGTTTGGTNSLDWDVIDGEPDVQYTITKTFEVIPGVSWIDLLTETLTVEEGPAPDVVVVEFDIPAAVYKTGSETEVENGDYVTYTIVLEFADMIRGHVEMSDVLPDGVEYANALTADFGTAWYDAGDNAVYWEGDGAALPMVYTGSPVNTEPHRVELKEDSVPASEASIQGTAAPMTPDDAVALVLDDGTIDNAYGVWDGTYAVQFIWGNFFAPDPADYPFTLDQVQVYFDSGMAPNVGGDLDIVIYEDPDSNPLNGANWLATYNETIQVADGVNWSIYDLDPPVVLDGPGDVLILLVNRFVTSGATTMNYPASLDQTSSQHRSWRGWYSAGDPPDPPTLPADARWSNIDDFLPGNWMIRGYGETLFFPSTVTIEFLVKVTATSGEIVNEAEVDYNGMMMKDAHVMTIPVVFRYMPLIFKDF